MLRRLTPWRAHDAVLRFFAQRFITARRIISDRSAGDTFAQRLRARAAAARSFFFAIGPEHSIDTGVYCC